MSRPQTFYVDPRFLTDVLFKYLWYDIERDGYPRVLLVPMTATMQITVTRAHKQKIVTAFDCDFSILVQVTVDRQYLSRGLRNTILRVGIRLD